MWLNALITSLVSKHSNKHFEKHSKNNIHQENFMNNPMPLSEVLYFINFS